MNIEEYIKQQNTNLHQPDSERIWKGMEQKRKRSKATLWKIVKSIAAVLFIGILVGTLIRHELKMQEQITSLAQINAELADQENDYSVQVANKWATYTGMQGNDSPITPILIEELQELDTLYQKGIQDLTNEGYNERAIIILLDTYEKRLRIIEQLIYEKEKQIRYENKNKQVDL